MKTENKPLNDFYIGSPVLPEDLKFRESFIKRFWEDLRSQHMILTAPRRTGKTSVLDYMVKYPEKDFLPVKVFVQDLDHPADFMIHILDEFYENNTDVFRRLFRAGKGRIKNLLGKIKGFELAGFKLTLRDQDSHWRENWQSYGDELFEQVRKSSMDESYLLILADEFPDMIINMKKNHPDLVRPFLSWLRGHRQKPNPKEDRIRWAICGSSNLSSTLESMQCLDLTNDFDDVHLPFLTAEQVEDFVSTMLRDRGVIFEKALPQILSNQLGRPIPVFMQMAVKALHRKWEEKNEMLKQSDVDEVFADLIISSGARDKLQHFHSRIKEYYEEPSRTAAYRILSELSIAAEGLSRKLMMSLFEESVLERSSKLTVEERKQLFNRLMRDLENDFYVMEINLVYDFSNGLMKQWWRKYYA